MDARRVSPRWSVEALDDAANRERPRHGGRLPAPLVVAGRSRGSHACPRHSILSRCMPTPMALQLAVIVDAAGGGHPSATTFAELNADVNRLAHALRALAATHGDRLVWCGPNSLEVLTIIHAARKAALTAVPLSYRFNAEEMAVRHRQLRCRASSSSTPSRHRSSPRCGRAPEGPCVHRLRRRRARRASTAGTTCSAGQPDDRARARCAGFHRGRVDDLHVRHDREAQGRAAHDDRRGHRVRAPRRATAAARQRGAPHDRAAVPLRPARVGLAQPHAGVPDRRPPQVRRRPRGCASSTSTASTEHVLRADAAEADREPACLASSRVPTCRRCAHCRERRARAVRAQAGAHREARRRVPLRGLRLDRAWCRHRARARGPAAQARLVRQAVRRDRGAHRRATTAPKLADG